MLIEKHIYDTQLQNHLITLLENVIAQVVAPRSNDAWMPSFRHFSPYFPMFPLTKRLFPDECWPWVRLYSFVCWYKASILSYMVNGKASQNHLFWYQASEDQWHIKKHCSFSLKPVVYHVIFALLTDDPIPRATQILHLTVTCHR